MQGIYAGYSNLVPRKKHAPNSQRMITEKNKHPTRNGEKQIPKQIHDK